MGVVSNDGAGHHSNAGVETGCTSLSIQVSRNKIWMMLFSPKAFQVGTGRDSGVSFGVHAGKVGDDEKIGTAKKR